MSYKYVWGNRRFYCAFSGIVSWEDLYSASGALYGSSNLENAQEVIIVFEESAKLIVTPDNATELAYLDKAAATYKKWLNFAIVVIKPEAKKFALNYIKASAKIGAAWNYQIFEKIEDAEEWLGIVNEKKHKPILRK